MNFSSAKSQMQTDYNMVLRPVPAVSKSQTYTTYSNMDDYAGFKPDLQKHCLSYRIQILHYCCFFKKYCTKKLTAWVEQQVLAEPQTCLEPRVLLQHSFMDVLQTFPSLPDFIWMSPSRPEPVPQVTLMSSSAISCWALGKGGQLYT